MSTIESILLEKINQLEKQIEQLKALRQSALDEVWSAATILQSLDSKNSHRYFEYVRNSK